MATITRFEDLEIWKEARLRSLIIYEFTQEDVLSKEFRFKEQIKSAAGSVMDNIAEGFERKSNNEFKYFLYVAKGSNGEVRNMIYLAKNLNYITEQDFQKLFALNDKLNELHINNDVLNIVISFIDSFSYESLLKLTNKFVEEVYFQITGKSQPEESNEMEFTHK